MKANGSLIPIIALKFEIGQKIGLKTFFEK